MVVVTRINFGASKNSVYINNTAHEILSQYMCLNPAQITLLDDEIDFILSRSDVYPRNSVGHHDTIILTADTRGTNTHMRCHRRIGARKFVPISTGLHATALTQACISRYICFPVDLGILQESNPTDVILRTNRKLVKCTSYGTELNIIIEKHWRGPWITPSKDKIHYVQDPVYFIEVEVEGDACTETCIKWLETLIPSWMHINKNSL